MLLSRSERCFPRATDHTFRTRARSSAACSARRAHRRNVAFNPAAAWTSGQRLELGGKCSVVYEVQDQARDAAARLSERRAWVVRSREAHVDHHRELQTVALGRA